MGDSEFVDYYELLQLSPNADSETVERVFRHLAKKYHPDNADLADKDKFLKIVEAHQVLSDPEARAGYDVRYQDYWNHKWVLTTEAMGKPAAGDDKLMRERLVSLLYTQRRNNMKSPGLGEVEMARLLRTPLELVEFHLWYLRAKGWVERLETGHLAITALGVDQAEENRVKFSPDRLIEDHGPMAGEGG
ncbi:MAG: DnaJ domain-containing protein [Desulforhopalus sp.]